MPNPQEIQGLVQEVAQKLQDRRLSVAVVGDMILDNAIEGVPGARHPEIGVPILRDATPQESIRGDPIEVLGRPGPGAGQFSYPWTRALHSGRQLYICV